MTNIRGYFLFRKDGLLPTILILLIGIGLVITMYQAGGLSAGYPYNLIGFVGYFLIGYVLVKGGIVDMQGDINTLPQCLSRMISTAEESILIFAGGLTSAAYLYPSEKGTPIDLLLNKAVQGVRVEIITERDPDENTLQVLREKAKQVNKEVITRNFHLSRLSSPPVSPREHFMTVDGSWVRVEARHPEGQKTRGNRLVRHSFHLATILDKEFFALSEKAEKIPILEG